MTPFRYADGFEEHGTRFEARIDRQSEEQLIVRFHSAGKYARLANGNRTNCSRKSAAFRGFPCVAVWTFALKSNSEH